MLPIAILVSGSGSNLQAILDRAAAEADYAAEPVIVISDRPEVRALERAEAAGVASTVVDWKDHDSRQAFTSAVCDAAEDAGAEALILAGFMRILSKEAVDRFPNRILNTHPALLPAFRGGHAVRDAIEHGVKVSGMTIHFVDEQVDHGPIIAQEAVPVLADDDEASLQARIQVVEHRLYPEVIHAFASGRLTVRGRKVEWP